PVGRFLTDVAKLYFGSWSSGISLKINVSDWPHVLTVNRPHENGNKNWQYQSSYAEDGKKKDVISYFDGTLRNRQTVTRLNSTMQSVAGEVLYDNQGRPAIEVLPVPLQQSAIRYFDRLNLASNGTSLFNHDYFDWEATQAASCNIAVTPGMSSNSGASRYYSASGAGASGILQDFVPNAEMYPFSQTEYTPDNTGRISRKGGVGINHQLGSGHEMQYLYSTPAPDELDRLFGYRVGYSNRYKKNVVIDPNGQVSITYIDPQGRTVATALSGKKPSNLESLDDDLIASVPLTNDHIVANTPYTTGRFSALKDGAQISSQIIATAPGNSSIGINYTATASGPFNDICIGNASFNFVYDWSVSLRNDCGLELLGDVSSRSGTVTFDAAGNQADASGNVGMSRSFSADLPLGNYTLYKNTVINQESVELYADTYIAMLKDPASSCYVNPVDFSPQAASSTCSSTCKECEKELIEKYIDSAQHLAYRAALDMAMPDDDLVGNTNSSDRRNFIAMAEQSYILTNLSAVYNVAFSYSGTTLQYDNDGNIDTDEVELFLNRFHEEFQAMLSNCRSMCDNSAGLICTVNEQMMLADLMPTGQYGSIEGIYVNNAPVESAPEMDPLSIYNTGNFFLQNGYISNGTGPNPGHISNSSWKHPDPAKPYRNEDGNLALIEVEKIGLDVYAPEIDNPGTPLPQVPGKPGFYYARPEQLKNVADFLNNFSPSWAHSLLIHHPEYYYYLYRKALCET
ncbi:hypothetical protein VF13_40235, partial [Nostoc linckia z16]